MGVMQHSEQVKMKRDMLVKTTFHTECVPETWEEVEEF
jgi:hypothetical protein